MEDKNTRIYLIGFMGCGKSYAGRHLAEAIGWSFLDLDRQIEQDAGRPISGIFAESGESAFRTMERSALHRTGELARTIISCGGGLPCFSIQHVVTILRRECLPKRLQHYTPAKFDVLKCAKFALYK